jgi:hypothetical protein
LLRRDDRRTSLAGLPFLTRAFAEASYCGAVAELMVPIFRVADGEAAARWYARLGFSVDGVHRFAPDLPRYMFLRRGDVWLHLSEHLGDARPHALVYFYVDDVDTIAAEFGAAIQSQPWAREIQLTDPDGNRLRIGTRTTA